MAASSYQDDGTYITLEPYSDKSFVISGELTRQYTDDLKSLGGKYNSKLRTGPGWIFSNKSYDAASQFVEEVNSGERAPSNIPAQRSPSRFQPQTLPPRPVPARTARPAPVAAPKFVPKPLQPITPRAPPPISRTQIQSTRTEVVRPQAKINIPLPPLASRININNPPIYVSAKEAGLSAAETADTGDLEIQTVTWIVEIPTVGMTVNVQFPDFSSNYKVKSLQTNNDIVDTIFIVPYDIPESESSILQICNGKWQARGIFDDHEITFSYEVPGETSEAEAGYE